MVLALSTLLAGAQPAVRLTVNSYEDLSKAVNRVTHAVDPSAQGDMAQLLGAWLGLTNMGSIDTKRSWEIAVWYDGNRGGPILAAKLPITNLTQFRATLSSEGYLSKEGKDWSQLANGFSSVILTPTNLLTESEWSALSQWKTETVQPPKKTFELDTRLNEAARRQAESALDTGRAMIVQVMSNPALAETGADPKAMAEVFNSYFDLLDKVVAGFQEMKLGLEVTPEAITIDELVTAKDGSELSRWMQPSSNHLAAADLNGLDPEALVAIAGYVGKNDDLLKLLQKFTALGLQMQNVETNEAFGKDMAALFDKMLPVKFSGSVSLKDQFSFSGAYTFPNGNAGEAYAQMKRFVNGSFQTMVGTNKFYSSARLVEKHHVINDVPVDRFTMKINLDSPMFKMPGQKEQIEAFWPNGKLEADYALKDGKLYVAFGSTNLMQDLLDGKPGRNGSIELEPNAFLAGYFNLLEGLKRMTQATPMLPDEMKAGLAKLDAQKTAVEFQLSLDNQFHATAKVPMKLLRELGKMAAQP